MKTDIEISQSVQLKPIATVAGELGLAESEIDLYGAHKAKIHLDPLLHRELPSDTRYVVVTAMTPTPLGEGKTVTTVVSNNAP